MPHFLIMLSLPVCTWCKLGRKFATHPLQSGFDQIGCSDFKRVNANIDGTIHVNMSLFYKVLRVGRKSLNLFPASKHSSHTTKKNKKQNLTWRKLCNPSASFVVVPTCILEIDEDVFFHTWLLTTWYGPLHIFSDVKVVARHIIKGYMFYEEKAIRQIHIFA